MKMTPATDKALDGWALPSTWHTPHANDMERWYGFVDQYQRDHGFQVDETALRERIEQKVGGVSENLRDVIRERVSLMVDILDFLRVTKR